MARPQINIRVDEERKERWKKAAEESPEYDGLSHLIRLAVEQELAEGGDSGSTEDGQASLDEESTDLLREVKGTTDRVEGGVEDVKARLQRVEERVGQSGADLSFEAAVRETVPEDTGLTAAQIAGRLNARESEVAKALESLEYEGEIVQHAVDPNADETRWISQGD